MWISLLHALVASIVLVAAPAPASGEDPRLALIEQLPVAHLDTAMPGPGDERAPFEERARELEPRERGEKSEGRGGAEEQEHGEVGEPHGGEASGEMDLGEHGEIGEQGSGAGSVEEKGGGAAGQQGGGNGGDDGHEKEHE